MFYRRRVSLSRELEEALIEATDRVLGSRVMAIIVFGSSVYLGRGRDVDVLVVVDQLRGLREKLEAELRLRRELRRRRIPVLVDVHVFDLEALVENLEPGSFLSGLALGYRMLVDRAGVEERILGFLERLAHDNYVLANRYGRWSLQRHAASLVERRRRKEG